MQTGNLLLCPFLLPFRLGCLTWVHCCRWLTHLLQATILITNILCRDFHEPSDSNQSGLETILLCTKVAELYLPNWCPQESNNSLRPGQPTTRKINNSMDLIRGTQMPDLWLSYVPARKGKFKDSLSALWAAATRSRTNLLALIHSHVNYRYLSTPEKDEHLHRIHSEWRSLKQLECLRG